jgi:NADPH-dependent ferric siderophore reductase
MRRVILAGDELAGFISLGFDDHMKLLFSDGADGAVMRDFTPRRFDPDKGELWIDFFLHDAGPAAAWAKEVKPGATIEVGGPRGSSVISPDGIDCHLLIGDETALPAIERRLEELGSATRAVVLLEIDTHAARPRLTSKAALDVTCVSHASVESEGASALVATLRDIRLPPKRCFAWVAHETQTARALRAHLHDERGFDKKWIKAAGYWRRGASGAHEKIGDAE